jgi:hypothetical protein
MEYRAGIGGDCPTRPLALAEPDDSISAACIKATKNRSRHRDADRRRLEDPAMSKIPCQLLDMSSDGDGVSSEEGKMFLNNSSPVRKTS